MADDGRVEDENGEEDEGEQNRTLNLELLAACMKNDTDEALSLLEREADPMCEDQRQWSPLIWAASHGNETLTRVLIKKQAADVYKYEDSSKIKKKHSPLHWAAFKGHVKVLWLLMQPPQSLSHHERDTLGNTPLHQAAAGGSLECVKCLMAQGVDVFAKNNRGHTPYALCTVQEVQDLLRKAMNATACKATGKQFSSTVLRYLCSWSLEVFCEAAVTQDYVFESPEATEKEKPVTWCTEVRNTVLEAQHQLEHSTHLNQLETITSALAAAEGKPVDCKLVHKCALVKAKLESEIKLGKAMQIPESRRPEDYVVIQEALSLAIEDAEKKNADPSRVGLAKALRRTLLAEASLLRAVEGPQKTTPGHITMLEELTSAATAESANAELVARATKLAAKLSSEAEVQKHIAETEKLCEVSTFKDTEGKENLPPWCRDTAQFEEFHEQYKAVVERAESNQIDEKLMAVALEQLSKIETLLIERKQIEEEAGLKTKKK